MEFSYDTNPKQAAKSRALDMLAANKIALMSLSLRAAGI
jgi:hypothetical protein